MLLTPHRKEFLLHAGAALMVGFVAYLFWRHLQTVNALDVGSGDGGAQPDPELPGASPWGLAGFQPGGTGYIDPNNAATFEGGAPALSLSQALDAFPSSNIAPLGANTYDYQAPAAGDSGNATASTQSTTPTQAPIQPGGGSGGAAFHPAPTAPPLNTGLGIGGIGKPPAPPAPPAPVAPSSGADVQNLFNNWIIDNPIQTPQLDVPTAQTPKSPTPSVTVLEGQDLDVSNALDAAGSTIADALSKPIVTNPNDVIGTATVTGGDTAIPDGFYSVDQGGAYGIGDGYGFLNDRYGATDYGQALADTSGFQPNWDNYFAANGPVGYSPGGAFDDGSQSPYDSTSSFFYE